MQHGWHHHSAIGPHHHSLGSRKAAQCWNANRVRSNTTSWISWHLVQISAYLLGTKDSNKAQFDSWRYKSGMLEWCTLQAFWIMIHSNTLSQMGVSTQTLSTVARYCMFWIVLAEYGRILFQHVSAILNQPPPCHHPKGRSHSRRGSPSPSLSAQNLANSPPVTGPSGAMVPLLFHPSPPLPYLSGTCCHQV